MTPDAFENQYLDLFWHQQRLLWDNYACGYHHDLTPLDTRMYQSAAVNWTLISSGRRRDVLKAVAIRVLVDCHTDTASIRNRLDNWDHYEIDLESQARSDPGQFRQQMGRRMEPDVRELMTRRQTLARELGFDSYPHLVLQTEDLALDPLKTALENYVQTHLSAVRKLIRQYRLTWPNWFSGLAQIGRPSRSGSDDLIQHLLDSLGFPELTKQIRRVTQTHTLAGYAGILSVPDDIRILVRPPTSLSQEMTLYHELGHAVAHALNTQPGIFKTWTSAYDETMAVLMEHIAAAILFNPAQRRAAHVIQLLETTRCAISALFELELWQNPDQAHRLYLKHFSQLNIDPDPPEQWACDSFRSIDPVYIHNYTTGAIFASQTIPLLKKLFGSDYSRWGRWLTENLYSNGRSQVFNPLTSPRFLVPSAPANGRSRWVDPVRQV